MSAKEVPAFEWKLVGYVDGLTVTLLKSVERSEVEAQLERLSNESYYRDVTIYPIDAEVPPDPLAAKFAKKEEKPTPKKARKTAEAKKGKPPTVIKAKIKKTLPKPAAKAVRRKTAASKKTTAKKKAPAKRKTAARKKTTEASRPTTKPKTAKKTKSLPSKRTRRRG